MKKTLLLLFAVLLAQSVYSQEGISYQKGKYNEYLVKTTGDSFLVYNIANPYAKVVNRYNPDPDVNSPAIYISDRDSVLAFARKKVYSYFGLSDETKSADKVALIRIGSDFTGKIVEVYFAYSVVKEPIPIPVLEEIETYIKQNCTVIFPREHPFFIGASYVTCSVDIYPIPFAR